MPVLPWGPTPEVKPASVKVTTWEPLKLPLAGEIVGAALVCAEYEELQELPLPLGEFAGLTSLLNQPPELEPGVQTDPEEFWMRLLLAVIAPSAPIMMELAHAP